MKIDTEHLHYWMQAIRQSPDPIRTMDAFWSGQLFNATQVSRSFHVTFFNSVECTSLYDIWKSHPGNINHLSQEGNLLAYNIINSILI